MSTRRRWNSETIEAELAPIVSELGRMPKRSELTARGLSGLWSAMQREGGVEAWSERMTARTADVTHDDIARRAYFKSLEAPEGDPEHHWLTAESELAGR